MDVDNLSINIETQAGSAVTELERLEATLNSLSGIRVTGLTTATKNIQKLGASVNTLTSGAVDNVTRLANGLSRLTSIGKISPTFGNQIAKIGESLTKLDFNSGSKLGNLATGLSSIAKLEKAKLTSFINQLGKLPQLIRDLQKADLNLFTEQMERLSAALVPLSRQMAQVGTGFSNIGRNVGKVTQVTKSVKGDGGGLVNKLIGTATITAVNRFLTDAIDSMNRYIENVNLFTVALGEYAGEAERYASIVSDVMGIDPGEWMRNQGIFMTLASGFGVVSDRAYIMSKNLTQLGYDISSFFNINVEDSMLKLQSGISGELEPLRRLGWDLSVARLQQEAYNLGIQKSVTLMTQAEKAELRYYAIMRQVTVAQGDMSRTLAAPANQLRILAMQASMAARAIGSIFIPILNAVLPYAIAAAQAIRMVASAIASLFGFSMPEIDYSGVSVAAAGAADLADSANDAAGGLGKAAKAAKELKNATLGIDELNVISPPEDTAAGGGGGGGGGGGLGGDGFDFELPEYDFLGDAVKTRVDEIMEKLRPGIEWLQNHLEQIITLVEGVALGLLAWKLTRGFLDSVGLLEDAFKVLMNLINPAFGPMTERMQKINEALRAFGAAALFAVAGVAEVDLIKRVFEAFHDGEAINWTDLIGFTADYAVVLGALWGAFKLLGKGNIGLIIGTLVGGIPLLGAAFDDMFQNGLTPQNLLMLGEFAAGLGLIAFTMGPVPALITGVAGVLGGLALAMSQEAIPEVKIFDDTISDATKKVVEPFITSVRNLQDDIREIEFNPDLITPDTISNIQSQAGNIRETILNELDADRNAELAKLEPLKASMKPENYQKIVDSVNGHYDNLIQNINADQARIDQLLEQAGSGDAEIAQAAAAEIYDIIQGWQTEGVKALSGTAAESEQILTNLKNASDRITAEQASKAIQEAIRSRNETIAAAREQYSQIVEHANRLREAGVINDEEYNEWIRLAEETRDDTIQAARDQYDGIIEVVDQKLGEDLVNKVDHHTGEINTRWETFWQKRVTDQNRYFDEIEENLGKDYDETEAIEEERQKQLSKNHDDWWDSIKERAGIGFDNTIGLLKERFSGWVTGTVEPEFAQLVARVAGLGLAIKEKVSEKWEEIKTWWSQNVSPKLTASYWTDKLSGIADGIKAAFRNGINGAVGTLNSFIGWFNNKLSFTVPSVDLPGIGQVGGQTISMGKIPSIPTFAQGGYPTTGELFIANEAGPELIGQIGRQTAVANTNQMEDAITLGMSRANDRVAQILYDLLRVVQEKDLSVTIGDDRIGRANDRYLRSRGVTINPGAFADAY